MLFFEETWWLVVDVTLNSELQHSLKLLLYLPLWHPQSLVHCKVLQNLLQVQLLCSKPNITSPLSLCLTELLKVLKRLSWMSALQWQMWQILCIHCAHIRTVPYSLSVWPLVFFLKNLIPAEVANACETAFRQSYWELLQYNSVYCYRK